MSPGPWGAMEGLRAREGQVSLAVQREDGIEIGDQEEG